MPYVEYDEVEASCPDCGRLFRSTEALDVHRIEAHGESESERPVSALRPVTCSVCRERFSSPSALVRHQRAVHPRSS